MAEERKVTIFEVSPAAVKLSLPRFFFSREVLTVSLEVFRQAREELYADGRFTFLKRVQYLIIGLPLALFMLRQYKQAFIAHLDKADEDDLVEVPVFNKKNGHYLKQTWPLYGATFRTVATKEL